MNNLIKLSVGIVVTVGVGYAGYLLQKRRVHKDNEVFLAREKQVFETLDTYLSGKDEYVKDEFLKHPNTINAIDDFMAGDRNLAELERAFKFVNDHLV